MKLSLMTLGCPKWDLDTILQRAQDYGFQGIDWRGVQDDLDITRAKAFTQDLEMTKRKISDFGLVSNCISSSIGLCAQEKLEQNIEEARRTIPLALALGVKMVRVFGQGNLKRQTRAELLNQAEETMTRILAIDGAQEINWLLETHDHWIASPDIMLLVERIDHPCLRVLWDIGHTARVGNENPRDTYEKLKGLLENIHLKDAVYDSQHPQAMPDGWRYVPHGTGQLPLAEGIRLLVQGGYNGWFTCEHEKRWHVHLTEPEELFPHFVAWFQETLQTFCR